MWSRIVSVVEGYGEVEALPILLRRIAAEIAPDSVPSVPRPMRIPKSRILRAGRIEREELKRATEFAARSGGSEGAILIVMDADEDVSCRTGPLLLREARRIRPDREIVTVLARREYESWFLAAARSLRGKRELRADLEPPDEPEEIRDPKVWLSGRMPPGRSYRETLDQPALTALMDLTEARRTSYSFDKLYREIERLLKRSP